MHEREHGERQFDAAAQVAEWDARYRERDGAMWSGRPNGRLVAEVADLTPRRAFDVGCGEGADAIWLARRGWTVTAIDISDLAVGRAREAAELAGAAVAWSAGTPSRHRSPPARSTSCRCSTRRCPRPPARPYGRCSTRCAWLLLAVFHDLDDETREHMKSKGVDPADYIGTDDLAGLLRDDLTVELQVVEPRIDPPFGTPHIADVVLRARRR